VKPAPPVRKHCPVCGRERHPERAHTKLGRELAALDPFDRSECAREWYGTQLNCSGCNCRHDQLTDGCVSCAVRTKTRWKRRRYEREGKQVPA
jgi:hypothetical protein